MHYSSFDTTTTIIAPATASGGATAVIRISGDMAIEIADKMFRGRTHLTNAKGYTMHYGDIVTPAGDVIDDAVVAIFRAPHSYTGDDSVEFTIHGSEYIASQLIQTAIMHGATMATPGEFTRRAFLAGKMDLSRAEAVADIIASDSQWSHNIASTQMRGGYSDKITSLRDELLRLCSLLELELDFSEEDVEFADRKQLATITEEITKQLEKLCSSFAIGNALKNGVNVAIVGEPNVGKSTLLNTLVGDDCAMVSDIAGTTRDTIEAVTTIDGVRFRFVDTAGLRDTDDSLEQMGIERTQRAMCKAHVVLHIASAEMPNFEKVNISDSQHYIRVINKIDKVISTDKLDDSATLISAKNDIGIDTLRMQLRSVVDTSVVNMGDVVVSSMRHYEAFAKALSALKDAERAMHSSLPTDLLTEDIRRVIHHLGEITGEITSDDILHSIFSKFCIGK